MLYIDWLIIDSYIVHDLRSKFETMDDTDCLIKHNNMTENFQYSLYQGIRYSSFEALLYSCHLLFDRK